MQFDAISSYVENGIRKYFINRSKLPLEVAAHAVSMESYIQSYKEFMNIHDDINPDQKQDENVDPLSIIKNETHREIIRKALAGQRPPFIAFDLKFTVGFVYNVLTECRKEYPELNIPYLRKPKK